MEEIFENFVKVGRNNNVMMAHVLTFEKKVIQIICACGPESIRSDRKKVCFYNKTVGK